jgi:hypothetical protein
MEWTPPPTDGINVPCTDLILEISLAMAQEKRRFFRANRGKLEVRRPTENFLMEIFG